ncbi:MAG TPA: DUF1844 domain-containing protein [bacterium]|nr:DUF1844 domain-containing protein [bacterium]HEX68028.1 DUF1844 domain-containing protein [bacterium]
MEKEIRFLRFVENLYLMGLAQLGKLVNPATGKVEKNLSLAQETIETLRMLEEKTRGNLTQEEESYLKSCLTNLQLNFVEERRKEKEEEKKEGKNKKQKS